MEQKSGVQHSHTVHLQLLGLMLNSVIYFESQSLGIRIQSVFYLISQQQWLCSVVDNEGFP